MAGYQFSNHLTSATRKKNHIPRLDQPSAYLRAMSSTITTAIQTRDGLTYPSRDGISEDQLFISHIISKNHIGVRNGPEPETYGTAFPLKSDSCVYAEYFPVNISIFRQRQTPICLFLNMEIFTKKYIWTVIHCLEPIVSIHCLETLLSLG